MATAFAGFPAPRLLAAEVFQRGFPRPEYDSVDDPVGHRLSSFPGPPGAIRQWADRYPGARAGGAPCRACL
jgi:hypothetical protein